MGHTTPQPPQFDGVLVVFTSQPSTGLLLQSEYPALHEPMAQVDPMQPAEAFAKKQTFPQLPQFAGSPGVNTSHPSPGLALQSEYPALHEPTLQVDAMQPAVAFATKQTLPQLPQFAGSPAMNTSQPSTSAELQLE